MSDRKEYFNVYPFNLKDFTTSEGVDELIESMLLSSIKTMRHHHKANLSNLKVVLFSCGTWDGADRDDKKFVQIVGWCRINKNVAEILAMKSGYKKRSLGRQS